MGGYGVAGEGTDIPATEFGLGADIETGDVTLMAVLVTVWVWAGGGDATAIRPDKEVAAAALPLFTVSELNERGFCAAGKIICGYLCCHSSCH